MTTLNIGNTCIMKNEPLTIGVSARQQGVQRCMTCSTSNIISTHKHCIHCGSKITSRIKCSQQKTWALLLTSIIFLIPANIYPITYLLKNSIVHPDTILSGIISLVESDMTGIAIIVFVASILVPILKIVALVFISLSVYFHWSYSPRKQLMAFTLVDWIGRWSILDLFVISIMVSVFDKGNLLSVYPGIAATSFTIVVVATLFAAESFDTRLIWDAKNDAK